MVEANNQIPEAVVDEQELPFALQFLTVIPQADLAEVSGQYNPNLQVWEQTDGKLSTEFPVASFPGGERPPTVCTVPTRVTPTITQADSGADD